MAHGWVCGTSREITLAQAGLLYGDYREVIDQWRATEEFVLLTGSLASVLRRLDPLRLGGDTVPTDEYDVEAGQLARILLAEQPAAAEHVAPIVDQVFRHYGFSPPAGEVRVALDHEVWEEYEALRSGR